MEYATVISARQEGKDDFLVIYTICLLALYSLCNLQIIKCTHLIFYKDKEIVGYFTILLYAF